MSDDDVLVWHRAALAGEHPPVHEDEIQCGWYCRRLEYRGPFLPARIFYEPTLGEDGERIADDKLRCEVAGVRRDPLEEWVWLAGKPISETEFNDLMAELAFAPVYRGPQRTKAAWLITTG